MKPTKRDTQIVNKRYRDLYHIETALFNLLQDEGDLENSELNRIWSELFEIITITHEDQ